MDKKYKISQRTNAILNSFKGESVIAKEIIRTSLKNPSIDEVIKRQYSFNVKFYEMK